MKSRRFNPKHSGAAPAAQRALLAAAVGIAPGAVHAQDAATPTLPPVVVSAATYAQPLSQVLPAASVITREQIESSGARNLSTLVARVAGVQITSNGGTGQSGSVYVRGFGSIDVGVLVLLDGVPLTPQDATGSAGYLYNLSTDQIERVEVIRGNVSAIYGPGAIGGVILITTRDGGKQPRASVTVGVGSRDSTHLAADASAQLGRTRVQAGFARETTQGIVSVNPAQNTWVRGRDTDGYRNNAANASLVQELSPGHELGLRAFRSDGKYTDSNGTASGENLQQLVQLFSDNQFNAAWTSHLSASQQVAENINGGSYASSARTQVQQVQWRNVVRLNGGWNATGGLQVQHQSIDTTGTGAYPAATRNAQAVFAGLNGQVAGNEVQLNWRHDAVDGYAGQDTGYLGLGRPIGKGFKLIGSYATAFNVAPLGYLYYTQLPYWAPNPNLKPERAHSVEGGLQWSQGPTVLRATAFQTSTTDQWGYGTDAATGATQFQNIARARTRGVELTGRGAWQGWGFDANVTLQQAVDLTKPGEPGLTRRARSLANVSLEHELGRVLLGGALHYTGPRPDSANGVPVVLGSYVTLDVSASGAISRRWSWNARVQNLFDKKYQTVWGYNREPLGVFLNLTWRPLGW